MKKKVFACLLIIVFSFVLTSCNKTDGDEFSNLLVLATESTFSLSEVQVDFNSLVAYIYDHSPMLYTDEETLSTVIEEQELLLFDGMTELEFLRVVVPIVTTLNCGHTGIYLSEETDASISDLWLKHPIRYTYINDKLMVISVDEGIDIEEGSQVIRINSKSVETIMTDLLRYISSDGINLTAKYARINSDFWLFYSLYIDATVIYEIEYIKPDTTEVLLTTVYAQNQVEGTVSHTDTIPYISTFEEEYAILKMPSFYPNTQYTMSDYLDYIDDFFEEVRYQEIDNIILDVRDNLGGNPIITSRLFSYLAKVSQPYFDQQSPSYYIGLKDDVPLSEPHFNGNLYTIMNGNSFSSTGHLLALLKYQDIGVFIGEESGGSFACSDSSQMYILPITHLRLHMSTQIWSVDVSNITPGRGIMPDIEATPALDDYINKNDSILESVINLILN